MRLLVQVGDVVEPPELFVNLEDRRHVLAVDGDREATKSLCNAAERPIVHRFGEQPEHDAILTLEHDMLGHAGRRLRPSELPVEGGHAADVPACERDRADPYGKIHRTTNL